MATVDQLRKVGLRESWVVGTEDSVNAYLRRQIAIVNKSMAQGVVTELTKRQLDVRLKVLNEQLVDNYGKFVEQFVGDAQKLALIDAKTETDTLNYLAGTTTAVVPSDKRVLAAIKNVSFTDWTQDKTVTAKQITTKLSRSNTSTITNIIKSGYINGASNKEITQQIVGVRVKNNKGKAYYSGGYTNGVHKRDVNTSVRTITQKMSQNAREETFKKNDSMIRGVEFVATLDNRTTMVCASYDGTIWKLSDANRPIPPLHWSCRSTLVAVVYGQNKDPLDYRVAKDAKTGFAEKDLSTKTSAKKKRTARAEVPANVNYDQFLRGDYAGGSKQPTWFVEDILGKERAKLYLSDNNIQVKDMMKGGSKIPLKELEEKYKRANK